MAKKTRVFTFDVALPWVATLTFFLDVLLLFIARPLHEAFFEGELGLIEGPTFVLLFATVPIAVFGALRSRGATRTLFILLAVGCLYWGGEEVSWGQTFFHWITPHAWSRGNYQHETNLHNVRGIVGTLLNQTPRFILQIVTVVSVALNVPLLERIRPALRRRFPEAWIVHLERCWVPAALSIAASIVNKYRPLGYRDFGESEELFTAILLIQFTVLQVRSLSRSRATPESSDVGQSHVGVVRDENGDLAQCR